MNNFITQKNSCYEKNNNIHISASTEYLEKYSSRDEDIVLYEDATYLITVIKLLSFTKLYSHKKFGDTKDQKETSKHFKFMVSKSTAKAKRVTQYSSNESFLRFRFHSKVLYAAYFQKYSNAKYSLKPYQVNGVKWLNKPGSKILGDDMGLGKTAQAISAMNAEFQACLIKSVLILCPGPLQENWMRELKIWAPNLCVVNISDTGSLKKNIWNELLGHSHIILTSYDQIRSAPIALKNYNFDLIIADEAHKVRKPSSLAHKNLKSLTYKRFWGLTGTPIENNKQDIISLLTIVNPTINPSTLKKYSNIALKSTIKKYFLRRLKKDVLKELPDLQEFNLPVSLKGKQLKAYQNLLSKFQKSHKDNILSNFTKLKNICDIDPVSKESAKIDMAIEIIEKILSSNEKCVIFSYTLPILEELNSRLKFHYKKEISKVFSGKLSAQDRNETLSSFEADKESKILLCSGKIAGEGLNLVSANHLIFLNKWWNPSNNKQARDRIHRIGQSKNVSIYSINTVDTLEDRVKEILRSKDNLTDEIIESLSRNI